MSTGKSARNKGMSYERAVVKFMQSKGLDVERVRAGYHDDIGDVRGPGVKDYLIDCKNHKQWQFGSWMDHNVAKAGEDLIPVLVVKRPQKSVGESYVVMKLSDFIKTDLAPF